MNPGEGSMEDESGGLFNIEVDDSESVDESEKVPRDFQTEEDFQQQRKDWEPKIEVGKVLFSPSIDNQPKS